MSKSMTIKRAIEMATEWRNSKRAARGFVSNHPDAAATVISASAATRKRFIKDPRDQKVLNWLMKNQ